VAVAAGGGLFGLHLQPVYATVIVVFLLWKIWA
jgi:hypothetical protein